jgi:uncharacterized protein (DUF58 family)
MLSAGELRILSRLDLVHRRSRGGLYAGERRSPHAARSAEFADFRPYVTGDDFRQVDWKAYARLERLMLRLYVAEEEACLNVILDQSASMGVGEPPKLPAAARLAAALAFLGLSAMDRVQIGTLSGDRLPSLRGRVGAPRTWEFLARQEPAGDAGPAQLQALRWPRPGLTVVISDFLSATTAEEGAAGWARALAGLRHQRQEPVLWQVLTAEEEVPEITGDLTLVDVESERRRELTITPDLVDEYVAALARHRDELARAASAAGGRFLHSRSDDGVEAMMLAGLRAGVITRG